MKTFQQFQQDIHENLASVALKGARNLLPALAAGAGALGTVLQARQSKPQMSPDYGQGGETAKPRKPAVQRGRLNPNEAYNKQKQAERAAEARARAQERAEQGIERLIGSDAERAAAAQARANQPQIQRQLRQQATRDRMARAAANLGLE